MAAQNTFDCQPRVGCSKLPLATRTCCEPTGSTWQSCYGSLTPTTIRMTIGFRMAHTATTQIRALDLPFLSNRPCLNLLRRERLLPPKLPIKLSPWFAPSAARHSMRQSFRGSHRSLSGLQHKIPDPAQPGTGGNAMRDF